MNPPGSPEKSLPLVLIGGALLVGIALGSGLGYSFKSFSPAGGLARSSASGNSLGNGSGVVDGSDSVTGGVDAGSKSTNAGKNVAGNTKDFATRLHEVMGLTGMKKWKGIMDLISNIDISQIPDALAAVQKL